jgi:hypothetical protein
MPQEELRGEHIGLEAIARRARRDDVARRVRAALGEWMHVVERGARILERGATIDAAATAVSHRGELERSLVLRGE